MKQYTVIVFFNDSQPKKWTDVKALGVFVEMIESEFPKWKYMNVYEVHSKVFIKRLYRNTLKKGAVLRFP